MKNFKMKALLVGALLLGAAGIARAEGGIDLAYFGIPSLSALTSAGVASGDYIPVYDVSADKVKKVPALNVGGSFGGSARIVSLATATTVDPVTHGNNKTLLLGGAGSSRVMTLPAATGTGDSYYFVVGAVNTSGYVIQVTTDDTIDGTVMTAADGGDTVLAFETASTSDTCTLNGTTTGGVSIGDWLRFTDVATDQWVVQGQVTSSGTEATCWSAAVT